MAKQKKLKNVKISEEELTPTVIGYLNERKSSPFFLLILFAILFAFLYFVPEIDVYINKLMGKDVSESGYTPLVKKEFKTNEAGQKFDFNEDTKIVIKEITLTDFVIEDKSVSFSLINADTNLVDFGSYQYYLYLFDENGVNTDIIFLNDLIVYESNTKTVAYDLTSDREVKTIIVDSFKDSYLNEIELLSNTLTCNLRKNTYIYSFVDNRLSSVVYNFDESVVSSALISQYERFKDKYSSFDGVSIVLDATDALHYSMSVDMSKADVSKLDDEKLFAKDTLAKTINYKMTMEGYVCN